MTKPLDEVVNTPEKEVDRTVRLYLFKSGLNQFHNEVFHDVEDVSYYNYGAVPRVEICDSSLTKFVYPQCNVLEIQIPAAVNVYHGKDTLSIHGNKGGSV